MKKYSFMLAILFAFMFISCGGGGSSDTPSSTEIVTSSNTISGVVDDDPVAGAEVYIDFGDGTLSTKAITNTDGFYELKLSDEDLAIINPEIPEGADGPRDNLLLVASKDGRVLRNALTRDVADGQTVYITNDTEAYSQYLESIGQFDTIALTEFNSELEKGRIKDDSNKSDFIRDIREDVKTYFYGGEKPTANSIFSKALIHLGKDKVALVADDSSFVSSRNVMSGGDILLPENVDVSSDDITLTSKGNGRYTVGNGSDSTSTAYLKIQNGDTFKLIPLNIKERVVTQLAKETITPQQGGTLGSESDSISATIPPFALSESKEITFNKIDSEGETTDGKMILDMQPSGLTFDMPITVKIKYSDFGIVDPNAVEWKYGSIEGGYENADIVSLDTANKLIYLSISHFSNLVVKEMKAQTYLDLRNNFVLQVPRRNKYLQPNDYTQDKEFYTLTNKIISNKLFEGASTSSRVGFGISGGHCVQFDGAFYYPLTIGKAFNLSNAHNVYKYYFRRQSNTITYENKQEILVPKTSVLPEGIRTNSNTDMCKYGDYVAVNSGYGTGHTGVFKSYNDETNIITLIQENATAKDLKLDTTYKITGAFHKRFGIGETFNTSFPTYYGVENSLLIEPKSSSSRLTKKDNRFICIDPSYLKYENRTIYTDKGNDFKTVLNNEALTGTFNTTNGNVVTEKPYLYYLLDTEGDGVGITKNDGAKYYGFDPDILPVTPLKINEAGNIIGDEDSRYEIYVSNSFDSSSKFRLTGFDTKQSNESELSFPAIIKDLNISNQSLNFNGTSFKRLKQNDTNLTEFKLIPNGGVENYSKRFELRTNTDDDSVDSNKKVLFSPNVIDDYYVSWGVTNDNQDIPIGFWNSNGYNMTLGNSNQLDVNKIYASSEALNGYYMTLGKEKSVQWHFALGGYHAVLVHLPAGLGDNKDAEYKLYNTLNFSSETHPDGVRTLKISPFRLERFNSSFNDWYLLYEPVNSEVIKDKYIFDFSGDEYVELTGIDGKIYKVDAIRLQSKKSILDDATVKYEAVCSNAPNTYFNYTSVLSFEKSLLNTSLNRSLSRNISDNVEYEKVATQSSESGNFQFSNLAKGKYKVIVSSSLIDYKPQIVEFEVEEDGQIINLPKITLQKDLTKDSVKIKAINAVTGSAILNANVTVKFGLDRDDNSTAYSGITDSNGYFEVTDMPYGQYSYILSKDGFISTSLNLTVDDNTASSTNLSLSPSLADGEMRIRLTWGLNPRDLDSHLIKRTDGNQDYHIYYSNKNGTNGDKLDRDDTSGNGTETTTISGLNINSIYTYYVHNYHGDSYGKIKDSSASVKISSGETELTYYPPNENGEYWRVFTIENGIIKPCTTNCMGTTESVMASSISRTTRNKESDLFRNLPRK